MKNQKIILWIEKKKNKIAMNSYLCVSIPFFHAIIVILCDAGLLEAGEHHLWAGWIYTFPVKPFFLLLTTLTSSYFCQHLSSFFNRVSFLTRLSFLNRLSFF